jgi:hypothetical protein
MRTPRLEVQQGAWANVKGRMWPVAEAEFEPLVTITPADVLHARQSWKRSASPEFRALLDAVPVDGSSKHGSGETF